MMGEVAINSTRYCVISYYNMYVPKQPFSGNGGNVSFQIMFEEGKTNQISVYYHTMRGGYATGRSATIGAKTPDMTIQTAYNLIGSVYDGLRLTYFLGPGSDPLNQDTDGDGLSDYAEYTGPIKTDPVNCDTDGDGLTDLEEAILGTDPLDADTDGDGLLDEWENRNGLNPLVPESDMMMETDMDGDGLTLAQEAAFGTNPHHIDTDGDGLADGEEVFTVCIGKGDTPWMDVSGGTNLFFGASGTALDSGNRAATLPFSFTAGGLEFSHLSANVNGLVGLYGEDGRILSSSSDGNYDLRERNAIDFSRVQLAIAAFWDDLKLYPAELDSAIVLADVQTNGQRFCVVEYRNMGFTGSSSPSVSNLVSFQIAFAEGVSNRITVCFKDAEGNGDGRSATLGAQTIRQYAQYSYIKAVVSNGLDLVYMLGYGTDPLKADTDGDGLTDGDEVDRKSDPLNPDTDGDGLTDGEEIAIGSDPLLSDTDGDTLPDAWEAKYGWPVSIYNDPLDDPDDDGLNNAQEAALGTDPCRPDTDVDNLDDSEEVSFAQIAYNGLNSFDTSEGISLFEAVSVNYLTGGTTNVALPFPVIFDGLSMTSMSVNLNGMLELFGPEQSNFVSRVGNYSNRDLTKDGLDYYGSGLVVAGLWDNLYVYRASDSSITLADIQTNGNRYCVVDYRNMRVSSTATNHMASFQIVFTEGLPDRVSVFYQTVTGNGDGRSATLGIISSGHTIQYAYNTNSITSGLVLTYRLGTDTNPLLADTDGDELSDYDEVYLWQTDPTSPDTDGDLWLDGFEAQHHDPETGAFHPLVYDAWDDDPDGDGLTNIMEFDLQTNPAKYDTDNDERPDGVEAGQASDPRNPANAESQPSALVHIYFGDKSASHSEKYKLIVTPISGDTRSEMTRVNREFGEPEYFNVRLVLGARYRIELVHDSTNMNGEPDCDYTLTVSNALIACVSDGNQKGSGIVAPGVFLVAEDPDQLLGTYETMYDNTPFAGEGKHAVLSLHSVNLTPEELFGCPRCLESTLISLTNSYIQGGVIWDIQPRIPDGASLLEAGRSVFLQPGLVGTNYFVTATSVALPDCVATSKVTVCVPGNIVVTGDFYDEEIMPGECHKNIFHSFYPSPAGYDMGQHFCFVQYVKGYMTRPDGSYIQIQMYGQSEYEDINFIKFVVDSFDDDDPAYYGRPGHEAGPNVNQFHVWDAPQPGDFRAGVVCDLQFKTGVYCIKSVPDTGASVNVGVGVPFDENVWYYQFSITTNAMGEKCFIYP